MSGASMLGVGFVYGSSYTVVIRYNPIKGSGCGVGYGFSYIITRHMIEDNIDGFGFRFTVAVFVVLVHITPCG